VRWRTLVSMTRFTERGTKNLPILLIPARKQLLSSSSPYLYAEYNLSGLAITATNRFDSKAFLCLTEIQDT
jgi:hypothetical protein